ncbi:MAG: hypothetical protein EXS14_06370 [Planctomycetes bacterium]|nr:hypothetical protein [Planctomycetota bacterium]
MKTSTLVLLAFLVLLGGVSAQTITLGTGTIVNTVNTYPTAYGNYFWGARHQFLITAAELTAAGGVGGVPIISAGFNVVSFTGQAHMNYDIKMGHTAQTVMTNWEVGLTWVYNAASYMPVPGWNTHTFCAPFVWDGVSNVIVETCHQNGSYIANAIVNQTAGLTNQSKWWRQDSLGACPITTQTGVSLNRPNIQLTFGVAAPVNYQTNSSGANLTMGTASTNGCIAPIFNQSSYTCGATIVGATGTIAFSSTALGMPWDIVISPANLLSVTGGALIIPAGIINLDLSQPFGFVNGFFGSNLPNFTFPGVSSVSLSWGYSISATLNTSMQAMAINPTAPGGASLSQPVEYHNTNVTNGVASFAGPIGDDTGVTVNLTQPQICWPSVTMYGTVYTQMQVISNGRIMFQPTVNTDFSPTIAEAQLASVGPFVGFWTDLNPTTVVGALITASQPAPGLMRVDYTNIAYDLEPSVTINFGVQFDTTTGMVQLDGLLGINANPQIGFLATADAQYFGMSRGAGATDGGTTTFAAGGSGLAVSPTAMWYDWYGAIVGGAGRVNSLNAGTLNTVLFTPSALMAPNYNWAGF